jgi:hypothetical protein
MGCKIKSAETSREKFLPLIPCEHFTSSVSVSHFHSQSSWNTSYVLNWNSSCFKIVISLSIQLESIRQFSSRVARFMCINLFSVDLLWIECMSAVLTGARSAIGTAWSNSTRQCRGPLSKKQTALQKS